MEYRLANGSAITDEDIERECAEYESGSWEGNLVNLRADRSKLSECSDVRHQQGWYRSPILWLGPYAKRTCSSSGSAF